MWNFKKQVTLTNPRKLYLNGLPEVDNWVVSEYILCNLIPTVGIRPYPLAELQLLVDAILWLRPSKIFEWGTHIGVAAHIFSETLLNFDIKGTVYSVDLPDDIDHIEHPGVRRGELVRNSPNVTLIQGDGISSAKKILKRASGKGVLFFLDGDHSYESVTRELNEIGRHYREASIIGHDTFFQNKSSNYNIGPHKAFAEFMRKYPKRYYKIETNFGLPGMTLLIPKSNL